MDSSSTMDSSSSSDCHMSDDEFERFIGINLRLCRLWWDTMVSGQGFQAYLREPEYPTRLWRRGCLLPCPLLNVGRAAFFLINWLPFPLLKTFEDVVDQKKYRFEDKEWWGLCARQVDQRQGSRYNAYMVRTFGGQNCLKHFSRWALHQPRNFSRAAEAGKPETVAGAA